MDSYKEIIQLIREKPNLYLSERSIFCLESFLTGWSIRNHELLPDKELMGDFQDWIQEKYRITLTQSWSKIIFFHSIDDFYAFETFFKLYDEFMKSRSQN